MASGSKIKGGGSRKGGKSKAGQRREKTESYLKFKPTEDMPF